MTCLNNGIDHKVELTIDFNTMVLLTDRITEVKDERKVAY